MIDGVFAAGSPAGAGIVRQALRRRGEMPKVVQTFALGLLAWTLVGMGAGLQASPSTLPRYDHIIVGC